jgi:hypothetical protein
VDLKPSSSGASRIVSVSLTAVATLTVQEKDVAVGNLRSQGARRRAAIACPAAVLLGINDPVGLNPAGTACDSSALTILTA